MVSGKYSALSGGVAREQALSNIAANLANVNTTGFKKDRLSFAAMLKGAKQTGQTQGINYARIRTIGADFTLFNHTLFIFERIFNGVFKCDDVPAVFFIDDANHGGKRGAFTGTGMAGDNDHAARQVGQFPNNRRQVQILKCRHFTRYKTKCNRD